MLAIIFPAETWEISVLFGVKVKQVKHNIKKKKKSSAWFTAKKEEEGASGTSAVHLFGRVS